MQGILPDGSHFLVSGLPARQWYTEARIEEESGEDTGAGQPGDGKTREMPGAGRMLPPKARKALSLMLEILEGEELTGQAIRLHSNIPPGKGLSSSSADVLSVLSVVNDYLQADLSPQQIYAIAARVEPTDPCLSDDIVLFRQHEGITERTISLPPVSMIWFDGAPDRQVNTVGLQRKYDGKAPDFFSSLLDRFERAAVQEDYDSLFDCVTQSAIYNQSIIPLPHFEEYYQLAVSQRAGLTVAHSGTIIGLLTRPSACAALLPIVASMANRRQRTPLYTEQYFYTESNVLCPDR